MDASAGVVAAKADRDRICQRYCQKEACAIQFCLQRSNYQEKRCAHVIAQYKNCCDRAVQAEQQQQQQQ
ncbi:TPA: hypothetical protein N0F65_000942 [Lagenidium giganteum]|uniref:Cx9C motif-containing protein 4, mitochondrial n=1 Tax=Lagenidium giganteum TaxID=4803 RepID=A0AAV2YN04_9STRA|nr:TPA: hypothetical protein N0F65_000942 [Lagenidium giganteum]